MTEITIDNPVYIKDGFVTIRLPEYDLIINQRVKQIKGRGVADADKLTKPNFYHLEIIKLMLKNPLYIMEGTKIRDFVKIEYDKQKKKFIGNNWMRPISELYRKRILISSGKSGNAIIYKIDEKKAKEILKNKSFEIGKNYDISLEKIDEHKKGLDELL